MELFTDGLILFAALTLSFGAVELVRRYSIRNAFLDIPNQRSSHTRPTPRGGGLGIVIVVSVGLCLLSMWESSWSWRMVSWYLLAALVVAGVSWIDDVRSLPNHWRLVAHAGCALIITTAFGYWDGLKLPWMGEVHLGAWGFPVTLVWIVGLTNAYNFMDGIDGIAGGQGAVAGLGWAALGWLSGQPLVEVLGLLLAASNLGFLIHNWSPARIFMGDVGSAFLGFTFAILPVIASKTNGRAVVAGVLFVWPFVFDAGLTFLGRLVKGENVFTPHRSHLYQSLVISGRNHAYVSVLYISFAAATSIVGVAWYAGVAGSEWAVALLVPAFSLSLRLFVLHEERRRAAEAPGHVRAFADRV